MIVQLPFPATLDDLMKIDGKAELIGGRIVNDMATDDLAGSIAGEIFVALRAEVKRTGLGRAYVDSVAFAMPSPLSNGRESFCPDAAYLRDAPAPGLRRQFVSGPPTFAVEVRSRGDYGRTAERALAAKRDDYFEAGTLVVWDVDPDQGVVTKYTATAAPVVFRDGEVADAEPALPGWRLAVADVFTV